MKWPDSPFLRGLNDHPFFPQDKTWFICTSAVGTPRFLNRGRKHLVCTRKDDGFSKGARVKIREFIPLWPQLDCRGVFKHELHINASIAYQCMRHNDYICACVVCAGAPGNALDADAR